MDEQKRLVLAIVLSVIVLVGYQAFFVKTPDPAVRQAPEVPHRQVETPEVQPTRPVLQTSHETPAHPRKDARTITVTTPLYKIAVSEAGAAVQSFELKNYFQTNENSSALKQLVPEGLDGGILFADLDGQSLPGLKDAVYTAGTSNSDMDFTSGEKSLELVWEDGRGTSVKKIFTFKADSYLIDCDIVVSNQSDRTLDDAVAVSIPGIYDEEVKKRSRFAFEGPVARINNEYVQMDPDDIDEKNSYQGKIDWIGYTDRYFITALMPKTNDGSDAPDARLLLSRENERVVPRYVQKKTSLAPGMESVSSFVIYMGPKSHKVLSKYDNSLKESVNFGFFNVIAKPLLIGMNTIHNVIPNYGVAIILLTIIIKLIFWPLGTKSYKSMNKMKKVQPLMMELREKYKNDKQKMNQEVMALYKTYKVNPASGCLPMLVQMPIFFALYKMLYQAIELRHAPFVGWIKDLSAPDRLFHFDFSIPMMDAPYGIPVLTLLMGASFLVQQKMTPTAGDPMQARMMMLMPVIMTVLFINFPAGLVLYMFVNNIISMGQQYYIQKKYA